MTNLPKISIIMTAYNRENFIAESIRSALRQTTTDFELIIVDDGSTDKTLDVARRVASETGDKRIRIEVNDGNLGIARTRNRALELARAEYIAPLDSDDIWLDADKLKKQATFLDDHPKCALVGGGIRHIDVSGNKLKDVVFPQTDAGLRKIILRYNPFAQSALMYRKSVIMSCGAYSTDYKVCDDYNLWLCAGNKGSLANFREVFAGYRIHGSNITRTKRLTAAREILEIVRAHASEYPHHMIGVIKAYLRILLAYVRT